MEKMKATSLEKIITNCSLGGKHHLPIARAHAQGRKEGTTGEEQGE
jgi:hypothetical protein